MKASRVLIRGIAIILCACIAVSVFALIRGQMLVTRTYMLNETSEDNVRIVAIADLHGDAKGYKRAQLVEKIQNADPDLIVYLGDMVDRNYIDDSIDVLLSLTEILSKVAPLYYVDGNHELDIKEREPEKYVHLVEKMSLLGAVQLENEIVYVEIDEEAVNLCGITTHYYWGEEENTLTAKLREMDGTNVLICHYPESVVWYDAFGNGGLNVALCGHTHGGLVRIPFKGGMYAPEQSWWPLYDLGEYQIYTDTTWWNYGGKEGAVYLGTMIISGGLAGEHGVPRVNNPREITVVELGD